MTPYIFPFLITLTISFIGIYLNCRKYHSKLWLKLNYISTGIVAPIIFLFILKFDVIGFCISLGLIIGSLTAFLIILNRPIIKKNQIN